MDMAAKPVGDHAGLDCGQRVTEHKNKCTKGAILHGLLP
jgi:hypothetical protein